MLVLEPNQANDKIRHPRDQWLSMWNLVGYGFPAN